MTRFRIYWLGDAHLETFREKPPRNGPEPVRIKHYEDGGEIEAVSPYDAWLRLQGDAPERNGRRPFGVGDVLEAEDGAQICRYWGFEAAAWIDVEKKEAPAEALQALS
ncbi:MAG: hypothetical protein KDC27_16895 [Acidobacteria bacterium]|nr:hypothetical protein [Acidobacteriota bacterium]